MLHFPDTIAGEKLAFYYVETKADCERVLRFADRHRVMALDTESTGIDCYVPGWRMRTFQFGTANVSIVIPAKRRRTIKTLMEMDVDWIAQNGPHDIRSIDEHLGISTGVACKHELYIRAHHYDPRSRRDGGTGNGLKDLCCAWIDPEADKWEKRLKAAFKEILVPLPGQFFKSGPRRGEPKTRKARIDEGWGLIPHKHPAYIRYAASDPVLSYRLWEYQNLAGWGSNKRLYRKDHRVQQACDVLQRRGLPLDVEYNRAYSAALGRAIERAQRRLQRLHGLDSFYSTAPMAARFIELGAELTRKTKKGAWQVNAKVLKELVQDDNEDVRSLALMVLRAKQRDKRKKVYADGMYKNMDKDGRVHPSINSLAARTGRMSAGIFQQLPTKDET